MRYLFQFLSSIFSKVTLRPGHAQHKILPSGEIVHWLRSFQAVFGATGDGDE